MKLKAAESLQRSVFSIYINVSKRVKLEILELHLDTTCNLTSEVSTVNAVFTKPWHRFLNQSAAFSSPSHETLPSPGSHSLCEGDEGKNVFWGSVEVIHFVVCCRPLLYETLRVEFPALRLFVGPEFSLQLPSLKHNGEIHQPFQKNMDCWKGCLYDNCFKQISSPNFTVCNLCQYVYQI